MFNFKVYGRSVDKVGTNSYLAKSYYYCPFFNDSKNINELSGIEDQCFKATLY